jgi:CheY-like chemotaxis protein
VQQRNECRYVELALKESHGSVTKAADLLGLPGHQSVTFILNRRCPHLLNLRTPIKPRRRRIIQTHIDKESHQESKAVRPARILHVEDDETVAAMAKEMLEEQGWQVQTCADGSAAFKEISGKEDYDLLLVDYDLPGINGLELIRHARELDHRCATPMVVLSASPVEAAARDAGADVFLHKPQDVSSLVETINRLLEERAQEQEPS